VATYDAQIRIKVANLNQLKKLEDRVNKVQNALQGKSPTGKQAKANIAATSPELQKEKLVTKELKKQLRIRQQMKKTPGGVGGTGRGGKGGALSGALISGAFPLLFGQGPLGGLAGFGGGFIGGKVGGQMGGFAGGLIATAALTQINTAVDKVKELGKALSVENLNLDTIVKAVGGVGTSTEKYLKLLEQVEGKQAAYNAAVNEMRSIVGDKGVKDIQEFTKRMQDLTNGLSKFFTKLGAGFAGIFNRIDKAIANSGLGKAANETSLRLDRIARAENSTNPLMVALIDKRDALIGSKTGRQATKVKNSPEFLELQNRIAGLQHFLDLQKEITDEEDLQKLTTDSILKNIKEQNQFLQESLSLGTFQAEVEQKVRDLKLEQKAIGKDLSAADEKAFRDQLKINDELKKQKQTQEQIQNILAGGMTNAVMGLIEGSKTLGQVLADVAKQLASMFLNRAFSNIFSNMFGGGVSGIGPVASGSAYAGMLGGAVGLYSSAGSFKAFRQGGIVTSPTMGIIGEGGESEYVIPASKMSGAMARYSAGARGGAVIPGGSHDSGTVAGGSGNTIVEYTGPTLNFNGDEYVPKSAVPEIIGAASKQGAIAGKAQVLGTLRNSRSQRASLGL
jgi:hypothetical protein